MSEHERGQSKHRTTYYDSNDDSDSYDRPIKRSRHSMSSHDDTSRHYRYRDYHDRKYSRDYHDRTYSRNYHEQHSYSRSRQSRHSRSRSHSRKHRSRRASSRFCDRSSPSSSPERRSRRSSSRNRKHHTYLESNTRNHGGLKYEGGSSRRKSDRIIDYPSLEKRNFTGNRSPSPGECTEDISLPVCTNDSAKENYDYSRMVYIRSKPKRMSANHVVDFMNLMMETVDLCSKDERPVISCTVCPKNYGTIIYSVEMKTEEMASRVLNLNGVHIPGDGGTSVPLEMKRDIRYEGKYKVEDSCKNWNRFSADKKIDNSYSSNNKSKSGNTNLEDRLLCVSYLRKGAEAKDLKIFMGNEIIKRGLDISPGNPIIECSILPSFTIDKYYAKLTVRTCEETEKLLGLNKISYKGECLHVGRPKLCKGKDETQSFVNVIELVERTKPKTKLLSPNHQKESVALEEGVEIEDKEKISIEITKETNESLANSNLHPSCCPNEVERIGYEKQEVSKKYEKLMIEYTELDRDYAKISQSFSSAIEAQVELKNSVRIMEEKRNECQQQFESEKKHRQRLEQELEHAKQVILHMQRLQNATNKKLKKHSSSTDQTRRL